MVNMPLGVQNMRTINNIDELNLPLSFNQFIYTFLENVAELPYVQKVLLFGSCATGKIHDRSDLDLFIITNRDVTDDEEFHISFECRPACSIQTDIPVDMIIQPQYIYDKYKTTTGMVEKYVELEGIDLSASISECRGNL